MDISSWQLRQLPAMIYGQGPRRLTHRRSIMTSSDSSSFKMIGKTNLGFGTPIEHLYQYLDGAGALLPEGHPRVGLDQLGSHPIKSKHCGIPDPNAVAKSQDLAQHMRSAPRIRVCSVAPLDCGEGGAGARTPNFTAVLGLAMCLKIAHRTKYSQDIGLARYRLSPCFKTKTYSKLVSIDFSPGTFADVVCIAPLLQTWASSK